MAAVVLSVHQTLIAAPLISVSLEDPKEGSREVMVILQLNQRLLFLLPLVEFLAVKAMKYSKRVIYAVSCVQYSGEATETEQWVSFSHCFSVLIAKHLHVWRSFEMSLQVYLLYT